MLATFVDRNMQSGLPSDVAGVEVGSGAGNDLHDAGLVPEGGVVHRLIPVLILG